MRTETPSTPGHASGLSANAPNPANRPKVASQEPKKTVMKGVPMRTAKAMDASLTMPVATTVRSVPMKLVIDQRTVINNFLKRSKGGKVSFTHIIGFAMVQALKAIPAMNNAYGEENGKPVLIENPSINIGLAMDLVKPDGTRNLVVPAIKGCEQLDFMQWWAAYEEVVKKGRTGKLGVEDFQGVTASLTNPGGLGTNHSVPRLMNGQGVIVGVGSIDYPPEFQGTSESRINELGVSKITTLTSTYDHRVIQGAQSGEFLRKMHRLLLGEDGFYDQIFESLRVPYPPAALGHRRQRPPLQSGAQGGPCRRADPGLPQPGPPHGRRRPAGVPPAHPPRTRAGDPRPDCVGPGPRVRGRHLRWRGPQLHDAARDPGHPA
ncbi:2-oxo acid dehydrogenase subunit E2 [Luteococcus japonicus]|uniref:2-oxo acid dehydrogenase subunit E2 n=1 Tax=Luteococcus japonicus TaxID=33984 RepID=UPI001FE9E6C2|nr:2-oxo acid dehydrogenase subunit E2 [Luteococcus japonicus]